MIMVTWRLRGSLNQKPRCATAAAVDKLLDRDRTGQLLLANPLYARLVRSALLHGERELGHFTLHSWVIMHNHVHAMLEPHTGTERLSERFMDASEAACGRVLWVRESWEYAVQTPQDRELVARHIENHPVRAGLVAEPQRWEWSSAYVPTSPAVEPRRRSHAFTACRRRAVSAAVC